MGRAPSQQNLPRIYLAEWLEVLGHSQHEASVAAGVGQSYIANIIAGRKKNPGAYVLLRLSEWLGITINDLFHPPPPETVISAIRELSPAAQDVLSRKRR